MQRDEADAKHQLLTEVINSRKTLKDIFMTYHIQQQQQARQAEGYFQPIIDEIKKKKFETPSNEEIKSFLKRHDITYDFLSHKAELTFNKDPATDSIRVYLGKNPKTWKEVTFNAKDNTMKVEGKEKVFDIDNDTTWRLLEGKDIKKLGLSHRQIKTETQDYIDMWEDRSSAATRREEMRTTGGDEYVDDDDFRKMTLSPPLAGTEDWKIERYLQSMDNFTPEEMSTINSFVTGSIPSTYPNYQNYTRKIVNLARKRFPEIYEHYAYVNDNADYVFNKLLRDEEFRNVMSEIQRRKGDDVSSVTSTLTDDSASTVTRVARQQQEQEEDVESFPYIQEKQLLDKMATEMNTYHDDVKKKLNRIQRGNYLPSDRNIFIQIKNLTADNTLTSLIQISKKVPPVTRTFTEEKKQKLNMDMKELLEARKRYELRGIEIAKLLDPSDFQDRLRKHNIDLSDYPNNIETVGKVYEITVDNNAIQQLKIDSYSEEKGAHSGRGVIIIPDNKEDLLDRLRILIAAKDAGHSDIENEKYAILERLLAKKHITPLDYKKLSKVKVFSKKL